MTQECFAPEHRRNKNIHSTGGHQEEKEYFAQCKNAVIQGHYLQ
jgi:hypothetical protein